MCIKTSKIILAVATLLAANLACTVPGVGEPPSDASSEQAIATAVAATLAAAESGETVPPSPTWTIQPTETPSLPEPDIVFQGISFAYDDRLVASVNAVIVPGYFDEGGMMWSTPDHIMFSFNDYLLPDTFLDPRIKVYKVSEFEAVNTNIPARFDALQEAIASQDVNSESIGIAEIFNAAQFYRAKVQFLDFQNGQGVRFLTQYGQAIAPVGWPEMFYTFQGLTDDGEYYISAIFPANHPSLPHPNDVEMDQAFMENFESYLEQNVNALNGQDDSTFIPSLLLLDELIQSLLVEAQ